jgi:YD repeat-containing protein
MGTDRYTYDEMSRITSGTAVTAQNADTQQFEYDGFGNVKTVTIPNKSTAYIDSDPATNRLRDTYGSETGANVLHFWGGSYDAAGNQLSSSGTPSYAYDSMNMLSEMTNPRHEFYLYDANDERVATVSYTMRRTLSGATRSATKASTSCDR